jgi:hypothetical protein
MKYLRPIAIFLVAAAASFALCFTLSRLSTRIDNMENDLVFEAEINARMLETDIQIQMHMQKEIEELQKYCLPNPPSQEGDGL